MGSTELCPAKKFHRCFLLLVVARKFVQSESLQTISSQSATFHYAVLQTSVLQCGSSERVNLILFMPSSFSTLSVCSGLYLYSRKTYSASVECIWVFRQNNSRTFAAQSKILSSQLPAFNKSYFRFLHVQNLAQELLRWTWSGSTGISLIMFLLFKSFVSHVVYIPAATLLLGT